MGIRYLLLGLLASLGICPLHAQSLPATLPDSGMTASVRCLRPGGPGAAVLRTGIPLLLVSGSYFGYRQRLVHRLREEVREEALEEFPIFTTSLDDYTRHAPVAAAYALHLAGVPGARGVVPFTLIYLAAHQLNAGVTSNLKHLARRPRPDNPSDLSSFPSSHTSEAFMTATLLHEQFGKTSPWISVGGYAVATATGTMRILHNKHWITDVVAGAGVGFLSAEAVWRAYPYAARLLPPRLAHRLLLLPGYVPGGGAGLTVVVRP